MRAGPFGQRAIAWRKAASAEYPFESELDGLPLRIRIGDFPAEPIYNLVARRDGENVEIESYDDWPAAWGKPVAAPFELPESPDGVGVGVTYRSGMEHAPQCLYGQMTLELKGDGSLRVEMRRPGERSCWEGVVSDGVRRRLLKALREAGFPKTPPPKGVAGVVVPGQTFDSLTVHLAGGAKESIGLEANAFRFDPGYAAVWSLLDGLAKQLSAGAVGWGEDWLGAGAVTPRRQTAG